jgi:hypothetical protein
MLGASLGCILGLFVGGILGAVPIVVLYEIRSGRIKIPPKIGLGPIKIDTSALARPPDRPAGAVADLSDTAPLVDTGGSIAAGCLSLVSAGMVLLGFILPWFTCNIANIIQGSFSGVAQLITLIVTLLTTVLSGLSGEEPGDLAASAVLAVLFVVVILFLALIPLLGLYIGFLGLTSIRSLTKPKEQRGKLSRLLIAMGLVGLVPLCCCVTSGSAVPDVELAQIVPGLPGIEMETAGAGLWITLTGFVVAIVAGFAISVTASLAEQMMRPLPTADQIEKPDLGEEEDTAQ